MERQPVKPEALEAQKDESKDVARITKGGDQAAEDSAEPVKDKALEAQEVAEEEQGERETAGQGDMAKRAKGPAGEGTPPAHDPSNHDPARLEFVVPEHPGERKALLKRNFDDLVFYVQEELKALMIARQTMNHLDRVATHDMVTILSEALVRLQDQREAHRLIERYFDVLVANPAIVQKLPGKLHALKRAAGGMAQAEKAAKADGREQAEKGKRKAESLLDELGDTGTGS